jgi:hypothetical protein
MSIIKQGGLFVTLRSPQTALPPILLLVPLESPQLVGVHQDGSLMFRPRVRELLNIR